MEKSYSSIHKYMHDQYMQGKHTKEYRMLDWSARSMLDKTTIVRNLDRAKVLRKLCDEKMKRNEMIGDDDFNQLFSLLTECFEVIVDDLMLLSAFELLMKRKLLAKGYVIHEVEKPATLKKKQRTRPLHRRTIGALVDKGEDVRFSEKTISIGLLLKNNYIEKTKVPMAVLNGLEKVRGRRNLVHFQTAFAWSVDKELLDFVEYLDKEIPSHSAKANRR